MHKNKKVEVMMDHDSREATRRDMLLAALAGLGAALIKVEPAAATPESMRRAIRQVVGEAPRRRPRPHPDPLPPRRHADHRGDRRAERRLVLVSLGGRDRHAGGLPGGPVMTRAPLHVPPKGTRGATTD